ncbi:DUF882 domain-containing protein [Rhizobium sp. CFBP 13726]|uniref:DUF882 domain-containing protein n=1 Tax=Rhizobium sp. CFBP 13726 TaxID=2775296 RepID=UPI0031408516
MSQSLSIKSVPGAARALVNLASEAAGKAARSAGAAGLAVAALLGSASFAFAEDRSLKLYFTHTGEKATITYKRDGRLDQKGLAQMNRFLRDWRRNETARMDPNLLDLVWEIYERSGTNNYIHVVSAYRSPATNNMLRGRSRSTGVARKSQHMLGKAIDLYIPGVKLSTLRAIAVQIQGGGVGYYPTSGSPFLHVDVGNVRAWPRLSRQELARIFPNGRTIHVPADGRPLQGYSVAMADLKRRGSGKSIAIARATIDIEADDDAGAGKRVGSGLITAMLPTPRSRALAALDEQTTPRPSARATVAVAPVPAFADLASLAIPAPGLRPAAETASSAPAAVIETASLGPAPTAASASALGNSMPMLPRPAPGFVPALALAAPAKGLPEPRHSLASLPITGPQIDPEDEFDGEDVLISWAISPPGASTGMTAPLVVGRTLTDLTAKPDSAEPLPLGIAEEFDHSRFWSDG